jgi:hypothetical protein
MKIHGVVELGNAEIDAVSGGMYPPVSPGTVVSAIKGLIAALTPKPEDPCVRDGKFVCEVTSVKG